MHVTIAYLVSKPEDFKICLRCGAFNWYENEQCVDCFYTKFRKCTEKDVEEYIKVRSKDEHFCDECEIDV
ncbi:MAG: hypothetical protein ACTSV7_00095 [Candidatus Baldrarchaeia archaeon]